MSDRHSSLVAHHFQTLEQQREASTLGMWVFLVTEVMFFGGLFAAYVVYRFNYPGAFIDASHHLDVVLGTINTGILLISSFTMALAVHAAQVGRRDRLILYLLATMALALTFLVIKMFEYSKKFSEGLVPGPNFVYEGPFAREAELFFSLYFATTGLHALHMIIGVAVMAVLVVLAWRNRFSPQYYGPVEYTGLYWHFVDIVWIYLFPLYYLLGRHL